MPEQESGSLRKKREQGAEKERFERKRDGCLSWRKRELSDNSSRSLLLRIMDRVSCKNQQKVCFLFEAFSRLSCEYDYTMQDIR